MSNGWAGGSTRAWRVQRARILVRDEHTCQIRGPKCKTIATQVHHKLGRPNEVARDADLEAACQPCNNMISDPTKGEDPPPAPRTQW